MPFLTTEPLELSRLTARVIGPSHGAVVTFLGTVRDHHEGRPVTRLAYSAYPAMVEAQCAELVRSAEHQWPVRVALEHRTGELAVGDAAVAIAVAGPHRDEAFVACRWVIEELKRRVPIWKHERYADGSEAWVDPTAPSGDATG